jgi:hypothetical protein
VITVTITLPANAATVARVLRAIGRAVPEATVYASSDASLVIEIEAKP